MNLLCMLRRHRWVSVEEPGEDPYQWCDRCHHYRSTSNWLGAQRAADSPRFTGGGGADFSGGGGVG